MGFGVGLSGLFVELWFGFLPLWYLSNRLWYFCARGGICEPSVVTQKVCPCEGRDSPHHSGAVAGGETWHTASSAPQGWQH